MTDKPASKSSPHADTIVIDKSYIREQANQALKVFVAPLSSVYSAAFGPISPQPETATEMKPTSTRP